MLTYGDEYLIKTLKSYTIFIKNNKIATITVVRPPARFGQVA